MKLYMFLDNAQSTRGEMETKLFRTLDECIAHADRMWNYLTSIEQKERDEFEVWELDNVPDEANTDDETGEEFYEFDYCTRMIKNYKVE